MVIIQQVLAHMLQDLIAQTIAQYAVRILILPVVTDINVTDMVWKYLIIYLASIHLKQIQLWEV